MNSEEIKKLGDVFLFLEEQQKKLEKVMPEKKEEVCEQCGQTSDSCDCDNEFLI